MFKKNVGDKQTLYSYFLFILFKSLIEVFNFSIPSLASFSWELTKFLSCVSKDIFLLKYLNLTCST